MNNKNILFPMGHAHRRSPATRIVALLSEPKGLGYRMHSAQELSLFIPMGSPHFFIIIFYRFDIKENANLF
jgi:hypothetical protein